MRMVLVWGTLWRIDTKKAKQICDDLERWHNVNMQCHNNYNSSICRLREEIDQVNNLISLFTVSLCLA